MKQIWPNYSYSPTTNVLTLTGLNIDRDQLLLVTAADRGRIMYNFADSSVTASAFTAGANTGLTLVASTAGLTTTAALVIYYDDQLTSSTVTVSSLPAISGTVTANVPLSVDGYTGTTGVRVTGCGSDGGLRVQGIDPSNFNPANLEEGGGIPIFPVNNNPLPISGTVTANVSSQDIYQSTSPTAGSSFLRSALYYENLIGGTGEFVRVNDDADGGLPVRTISGQLLGISGTVTAMAGTNFSQEIYQGILTYSGNEGGDGVSPLQVNIGSIYGAFPAGTNRIGVVTIGAGTVTIGAGTSQIGSVTASISGTVPVSGTFFQTTQPVSLTTLPTLVAGTAQIGSVTASISNTVVTVYQAQGTSVSNTTFTSITPSTSLVSAVAGRDCLTVFNEGAGNLHISPGATATTISYQVRLSAGDYWECPQGQLSLAHTAVFATAGTARVTEVS